MKAIIFDLDFTIFDNTQYIFSAFKQVSEYLSDKHSIAKETVYNKLISLWKEKTSMYINLFDDLLDFFKIEDDIKEIVKIFNNIKIKLTPYPDTLETLKILKNKIIKLGIITDGNVKRQKRKIKALGIKKLFNQIIYTKKLNRPKPSVIPFKEMIKKLKTDPNQAYYIGDNPLIDFKGAKKAGLITIRIMKGEFLKFSSNEFIDYEINSLKEIIEVNTFDIIKKIDPQL